ncbi:hypothetical protein EDB80DRAFT_806680 [Ilyonectria destructans]|nr:hypothetical protein EDB80DRAFT_806680 [Ilyonectria destructans]
MIERVETTNTQAKKEGRGVREEKDDQGAGGSNQRIGSPKERQMKICGRERTEEANKQKTGCRGRRQAPVRRNRESEIGVGEEEEGSAAQEGSVGIQDDGVWRWQALALVWALDVGGAPKTPNKRRRRVPPCQGRPPRLWVGVPWQGPWQGFVLRLCLSWGGLGVVVQRAFLVKPCAQKAPGSSYHICQMELQARKAGGIGEAQTVVPSRRLIDDLRVWTEHTVIRGVNVNQGTSAMMTQDTDTRYTDSRQEVRGCRGGCPTANQDKTPLTKMEHFEMTLFMLKEPYADRAHTHNQDKTRWQWEKQRICQQRSNSCGKVEVLHCTYHTYYGPSCHSLALPHPSSSSCVRSASSCSGGKKKKGYLTPESLSNRERLARIHAAGVSPPGSSPGSQGPQVPDIISAGTRWLGRGYSAQSPIRPRRKRRPLHLSASPFHLESPTSESNV